MDTVDDVAVAPVTLLRTPDQILGPFYPVQQKPVLTGDLTRSGRAQGTVNQIKQKITKTKKLKY